MVIHERSSIESSGPIPRSVDFSTADEFLAAKRAWYAKSHELFMEHGERGNELRNRELQTREAALTANTSLEYYSSDLSFEKNPAPVGFLYSKGHPTDPIEVERTPENYHLFKFCANESSDEGWFEVIYQRSADIVNSLSGLIFSQQTLATTGPVSGVSVSFFDTNGNCYTNAKIVNLVPEKHANGTTSEKHTALFDIKKPGQTEYERLAIPIDDIQCFSGSLLVKRAGDTALQSVRESSVAPQ